MKSFKKRIKLQCLRFSQMPFSFPATNILQTSVFYSKCIKQAEMERSERLNGDSEPKSIHESPEGNIRNMDK